jgi:hypothetical protein
MLKQEGDLIPVAASGAAIRRADVEHDVESMYSDCQALDGQIDAFEEPIAQMARGLKDVGTSTKSAGAFGTMEAVTGQVREQSLLGRRTGAPLGTAAFEPRSG